MEKKVYIVNHPRSAADKQVYMQSFCEAWMASGGKAVPPSKWSSHRLVQHLLKGLALLKQGRVKGDRAFVVCSRGGHLLKSSIPYLFKGEVIPMLWDCWPSTWGKLERDLRLLRCRLCFVTSSDVAHEFSRRLPETQFVHVPEGVDTTDYLEGKPLRERGIDVYEMGRKHNFFHKKLMDGKLEEHCRYIHKPTASDKKLNLVYKNWESFTEKLADSKVIISFPNSLTNPKEKGAVETLTMRYWEAMLSRCVIVGHCPHELLQLIGYNPIIEADFVDPCGQLLHILQHIDTYQELVNRNRSAALQHAPWAARMATLRQALDASLSPSPAPTGA